MNRKELESLSTVELRARAKRRKLTRLSRMTKVELVTALMRVEKKAARPGSRSESRTGKPPSATGSVPKAGPTAKKHAPALRRPAVPKGPSKLILPPVYGEEQHIEGTKYLTALPGEETSQTFGNDLHERIDPLPKLRRPHLTLLPQKPGVLHAFWAFPENHPVDITSLRLRLLRLTGGRVWLMHDAPLDSPHGHWYFQLPEGIARDQIMVQIGTGRDADFRVLLRAGLSRPLSAEAAALVDRDWWLSDVIFTDLYVHGGGLRQGAHLSWKHSASSPMSSR